jgi:hypothetical protein
LGLQWSRGCPFNCEFCDIIELFGRVPRLKTIAQVLAELDNLYALGYRGPVDVVDDNFIGNQKEVVKLLVALRTWQEEHGWPFEFGTEASLNLADRPRLLELMRDAGFCVIFVGIESPDEDTLVVGQKKQNTRRDIAASIQTIYQYGIMVMAGYIVGFDGEKQGVAEGIIHCVDATAIPVNMVGLLFALPTTQLTRRLEREGRLPDDFDIVKADMGEDNCSEGLNFVTTRPKSEILADFIQVIEKVYSPGAYFGRLTRMSRLLNNRGRKLNLGLRYTLKDVATFFRMIWRVGLRKRWGWRWWRVLADVITHNPRSIRYALWMATLYLHFSEFSRYIVGRLRRRMEHEAREEKAGRATIVPASTVLEVVNVGHSRVAKRLPVVTEGGRAAFPRPELT